MSFAGRWKNQFGSTVDVTVSADNEVSGSFTTALEDSALHGQSVPIVGTCAGNCISFAAAANTRSGDVVVSYTGLLREGKLETMWLFVTDQTLSAPSVGARAELKEQSWWKAVITNKDTFERVP